MKTISFPCQLPPERRNPTVGYFLWGTDWAIRTVAKWHLLCGGRKKILEDFFLGS